MYNNAAIVDKIASKDDSLHPPDGPAPRRRLTSDPVLPERLPSTSFIEREAQTLAPDAILRQLRRHSPSPEQQDEPEERERRESTSSATSSPRSPLAMFRWKSASSQTREWQDPQPFEVFRAVERKDITYLMEVRDRAFPLLLRKTGDATPLLHAMRIGKSHRDVAIILLGAFSRWVNHLEDEDIHKPQTRVLLKALRTNLKLAIDYGLTKAQSDLTASFLQTLIMSEGEKWVQSQTSNVSLALRAGTEGKPVETATKAVRKFATKELGKADLIATLEDYVANAVGDLLMMGAWSNALDHIDDHPIPAYYFARDDRVFKAFQDLVHKHKSAIQKTASKRLRWQIRVLSAVMEGRTRTYRSKVESLAEQLDEGEGV